MNKTTTLLLGSCDNHDKLPAMYLRAKQNCANSITNGIGQSENIKHQNKDENNFIRKALADIKPVLLISGFTELKLKNILVSIGFSKTKFFNYFGNLSGFYEVLLHHEFSKCYSFISQQMLSLPNLNNLKESVLQYRNRCVLQNEILDLYFRQLSLFTPKFEGLVKAVIKIETEILTDYIPELTGSKGSRAENYLVAEKILSVQTLNTHE